MRSSSGSLQGLRVFPRKPQARIPAGRTRALLFLPALLLDWEQIPEWLRNLDPSWFPFLLCGTSFLEHVFPPFPGDLVLLGGAWLLATRGEPLGPAWAGALLGSIAGAALCLLLGRRLDTMGRRIREGTRLRRLLDRALPLRDALRRTGGLLILFSRFLPVGRAFLLLGAGAGGYPLGRGLLLAGASAALWNGMIFLAARTLAAEWETLRQSFRSYSFWVPLLAGLLLLLLYRRALAAVLTGPPNRGTERNPRPVKGRGGGSPRGSGPPRPAPPRKGRGSR